MQYDQLLKDIDQKKGSPLYLLQGEEPYYIDVLAEKIENKFLTDDEKAFNHTIFYGKDSNVQSIVDTCRRFPMFSNYQVVTLREANQFAKIEDLDLYVQHLVPTTIFIICYKGGNLDKRKKLYKLIEQKGIIFESQVLKEQQIPQFIDKYIQERNFSIESKAKDILVAYLGTDLSKIKNELEKLFINLSPGTKITSNEIEENIGISKEYNIWELQTALLEKNRALAFTIAYNLNENLKANPFIYTLGQLHSAFNKLFQFMHSPDAKDWDLFRLYGLHSSQINSYRKAKTLYSSEQVEKIFALFLEYDLRSKGLHNVETTHQELLRELVYKILK